MFIKKTKSGKKTYHYLTQAYRDDRGLSQQKHFLNLDKLDQQEIQETIDELSAYRDERFGEAQDEGPCHGEPKERNNPTTFQKFWTFLKGLFKRD